MEIIYIIAQMSTQITTLPVWAIILGSIVTSGTLSALLTVFFNRKKTESEKEKLDADAADIIQRAAGELVTRIKTQSDEDRVIFHEEMNDLMTQNKLLMQQNTSLIKTVDEMRIEVRKIPALEKDINNLRVGIDLLTAQLIEHGVKPAYPPAPPITF
jgi:succinate dehydrogenase/fumarate reductase flavoprotein subunit